MRDITQQLRHDSEASSNSIENHNVPNRPSSLCETWLNTDQQGRETSGISTEARIAIEKAIKAS
jgi:hypothetical protein